MRFEDGSPLSMAGHLRWASQLQSLPAIPDIHDLILLLVLRSRGELGLEGDIE